MSEGALIQLGTKPSPPSQRTKKPNRVIILIIQTKNKNILQQDNSQPKKAMYL
jgi:hypothetical protein